MENALYWDIGWHSVFYGKLYWDFFSRTSHTISSSFFPRLPICYTVKKRQKHSDSAHSWFNQLFPHLKRLVCVCVIMCMWHDGILCDWKA